MNVAVVDYGAGNTRSVLAALRHVGLEGEVTSDPFAVLGAARVILPRCWFERERCAMSEMASAN